MGVTKMKWEQDLVRDIRRNNGTDDRDFPDMCHDASIPNTSWPFYAIPKNNSDENQKELLNRFMSVRDNCRAILEIGISREGADSFTNIFLRNKRPETIYIGIDIEDKSYLNNPSQNVFTIRGSSTDYEGCMNICRSHGVTELDFIFIDGLHSVNQVLLDWEYTKVLSHAGIVGFHDTQYHPGPTLFVNALDTNKWHVDAQVVNNIKDWGIGFAWQK
jgi:cephalosporin hydroxylase